MLFQTIVEKTYPAILGVGIGISGCMILGIPLGVDGYHCSGYIDSIGKGLSRRQTGFCEQRVGC